MNRPTEEQIKAALSAKMPDGLPVREYLEMPTKSEMEALGVNTDGYGISDIREDIIADYEKLLMSTSLSAALAVEAGAVGVKPLEWVMMYDGSTYHAQSIFGRWARWDGHYLPPDGFGGIPCDDPISAAQADYEARIRSALTPASSAVEGEAVAVLRALVETFGPRLYPADHVVSRARRLVDSHPAPTPAGDDLQAAVDCWADALRKCETENTRAAGHALDEAEEALLSFASPAPHQEDRADG
jgi:hypothetical protein